MKVEVISIGTRLLLNDILDTNSAYLSRYLREAHIPLICKVNVGDDIPMITEVLQVALRRADVVMTIGGNPALREQGDIGQAVQQVLGSDTAVASPWPQLGQPHGKGVGFLLDTGSKTIICFPADRREIAYILTTEVLPHLQTRFSLSQQHQTLTLRVVGLAESSLRERLDNLALDNDSLISYDSFAGQTNVQLWVTAVTTANAQQKLNQLQQKITARLGDHIFGTGQDRLEATTYHALATRQQTLAIVECNTDSALCKLMDGLVNTPQLQCVTAVATRTDLDTYLQLNSPSPTDLNSWCKLAVEGLREKKQTDLALLVIKQQLTGGSLILVGLASANGASVTQRSFGGHPDNINDWACTLALAHLRRWLLTN